MNQTEYELFVSVRFLEQSIDEVKKLFPHHEQPTYGFVEVGAYEGEVEQYRKHHTLKRIKRPL